LNFAALLEAARNQDPKVLNLITQSQQLSEDLSKEIRTLSYLLHPPLLDEAGLASAIRWYVEGFSKRSGIQVDLDLPEPTSRLSKALELVVFRVVQESLTNVHRHSGSLWAKIRVTCSPQSIQAEITDRGKGISPERHQQLAAAKIGVGVRGMEERVRQFGGNLKIDSSPAGTKVSILIPLVSE
jgi:signal transduction histidine kinase